MSTASTRHYYKMKELGHCTKCGRQNNTDGTRCEACNKKHIRMQSISKSKLVAARKQNGLCRDCGRVSVDWSKQQRCTKCYLIQSRDRKKSVGRLRDEVFAKYGGYTCACCNETKDKRFMQIDHMNNDGAVHRKEIGTGILWWLKKNNYPPGFQPLCTDCNFAKGKHGECPHQEQRRTMLEKLAKISLTY